MGEAHGKGPTVTHLITLVGQRFGDGSDERYPVLASVATAIDCARRSSVELPEGSFVHICPGLWANTFKLRQGWIPPE